ncbi:MAG: hypothetical protein IPJ98_06115 [Bryobacterales bacterium]|nr:hypothetical protein [Bryobacterales bacterium]
MPNPPRLPDGGILAPDGSYIPFAASCPPETAPDLATRSCVSSPGAMNVNYGCGGALAPLGTPGCEPVPARAAARLAVEAVAATGIRPRWAGCDCANDIEDTGGLQANPQPASPSASGACLVFAVLILAALIGGGRNG